MKKYHPVVIFSIYTFVMLFIIFITFIPMFFYPTPKQEPTKIEKFIPIELVSDRYGVKVYRFYNHDYVLPADGTLTHLTQTCFCRKEDVIIDKR